MEYLVVGLLVVIGGLLFVAIRRLENLGTLGTVVDRLERLEVKLDELRPVEEEAEEEPEDDDEPEEEPVPPPPLEVSVDFSGDLRGAVAEAIGGLERDVRKLVRILGRTRAEKMSRRIVQHLEALGYREIRVTGGLPRTGSKARSARVVVDAEIDGVRSRGHVTVRGGQIVETSIRPLNRLFP